MHSLAPFVVASKSGHTVTDVDGNVFVDLVSASGSVPLGAAREDLIEPAVAAMRAIGNEDAHGLTSPPFFELAERILAIAPDKITRVDISLNGTEAVETAIRMMRRATGRPIILGFLGGYHGESTTTAALGAETGDISQVERALVPGFVHAPYPNPYRSPFGPPRAGRHRRCDRRLHPRPPALPPRRARPRRRRRHRAGARVRRLRRSAGHVLDRADRALRGVRLAALRRRGQERLRPRRGGMLAIDRWGVEPDLICLGKAMGGGVMPIGAVLGTEEAMGGYDDLSTGSTWSWLPGSVAAALGDPRSLRVDRRARQRRRARADRRPRARRARRALRLDRRGPLGRLLPARSSSSATARRKERNPELQSAVATELCKRGYLVEDSTTSLNLQPSLLMPPEEYEAALGVVADVIEAVS